MKKLIVAACAVAMAVVANAGTVSWGTQSGQYIYTAGTTTKAGTLTTYLFDAASYSQADLLADGRGEGINTDNALATGNLASSKYTGTYAATASQAYQFYMVVVDDTNNNLYITSSTNITGPGEGKSATAKWSTSNSSKAAASTGNFASSGWYAVPEPTSGLLLLIGMAGLALRRRRA